MKEKILNRIFNKKIKPALMLSFAMSFMLFFNEPLALYFNNKKDYWFDVYMVLPICIELFAAAFVASMVGMLVIYFINDKLYYLAVWVYGVVFICTYIQGNFLAGNLSVFDGSTVDWSIYEYQRIQSIILWAVVIFLMVYTVKKFKTEQVCKGISYVCGGSSGPCRYISDVVHYV